MTVVYVCSKAKPSSCVTSRFLLLAFILQEERKAESVREEGDLHDCTCTGNRWCKLTHHFCLIKTATTMQEMHINIKITTAIHDDGFVVTTEKNSTWFITVHEQCKSHFLKKRKVESFHSGDSTLQCKLTFPIPPSHWPSVWLFPR